MFGQYRTWAFVAAFLLFGGALVLSGDDGWRHLWGGLSLLSLGGFSLSYVADAMRSGKIRLQQTEIRRADRPRLFRVAAIFYAATGAFVVSIGLWVLFFMG